MNIFATSDDPVEAALWLDDPKWTNRPEPPWKRQIWLKT